MISYKQWQNRKLWLEFAGPNGQVSSDTDPLPMPTVYPNVDSKTTQPGMATTTSPTTAQKQQQQSVLNIAQTTGKEIASQIMKNMSQNSGQPNSARDQMTPGVSRPMNPFSAGRSYMYPR